MQFWSDFRALPYSDEILVAVGALVTLLAVVRIVQSSLKMFFYVLLAGIGLAAVAHGAGRAPWESSPLAGVELSDLVGPGRALSADVLKVLCLRLEDYGAGD